MIPGRYTCPPSWTREYYGYLMSEDVEHKRVSYECMDINAEGIPGTESEDDGALMYLAEAFCDGLGCSPDEDGYELTCVVCTK